MKEAVIVSAVRTPGGKAPRGILRDTRSEYMSKLVMQEAVKRLEPVVTPEMLDDIIWGCSTPEQASGMNTARISALYAGFPQEVPAVTVNRFCASGNQAVSFAAEAIISDRCDIVLAGGVESMSLVPMGGIVRPNPECAEHPEFGLVYTSMGQTAENVAQRYGISREDQDVFAIASHEKCYAAMQAGNFKDEYVPVPIKTTTLGPDNKPQTKEVLYDYEEGCRQGLTVEGLGKLRPAFVPGGTVTAGNSSQTTDGASALVLMSADKAAELGIKPMAKYIGHAVAGCGPDEMGIGPSFAVPKVLKRYGFDLKDFGLIELNEAFASQSLYCIRKLGLNQDILNVNGGAIAMGHPLGCTGAKLTTTLIYEMKRRNVKYGMVTMCIGGGMGAATIFELCK